MTYRELTEEEIVEHAKKIAAQVEATALRQWVLNLYGPAAHKLEFEMYSESDDEGGSYWVMESAYVYDEDDNELSYDLTQPFFTEGKGSYFYHYKDSPKPMGPHFKGITEAEYYQTRLAKFQEEVREAMANGDGEELKWAVQDGTDRPEISRDTPNPLYMAPEANRIRLFIEE